MPPLSPSRSSAVRRCLLWMAAGCALGVQAAVVQPAIDLLQPGDGWPAAQTPALERALTVDTNTSQRNLELLLDARRAGEAEVAPGGGSRHPDDRRTLPAAEPRSGLVPLGLQVQDSVTAPGATERRAWQTTAPTVRYGGLPDGAGRSAGGGGGADPSDRHGGSGDAGVLAQPLNDAIAFLREHRFALLGGAALLAMVTAALQAYTRRR